MAGTYQTKTVEATPAESVAALVARLHAAMAVIAEEAGAWLCDYCGAYTVEAVMVEVEDTDGRIWSAVEQCPRCSGER
jgi:hypothetical protein